ncbi:MAG: S-layer homology domain-containing protein, partial [Candidatus Margulisbacteria bacterium]|nr:S-layer homology domain-containing protein [Candidatus Margulisiibacteriota bacterium]
MKKWAWLALPFICLIGTAGAEIELINPTDKLVTFDEIVMLQGSVSPPAEVRIEGVVFRPQPNGVFACGLVLNPGKNLVLVGRGEEEKKLRLLHLVTYPDIEITYDGKKHWARGQIVYLSSLKVIEGYPDGNFYPANPVTRGEFATWLARVKKLPVPVLTGDVFFDVPKEHWRAPYVKAVVEAGYMPPYSKEMFGIDDPISRSEAADLAVKTEGLGIVSKIIPLFRDVPQEELVAAPIYAAKEKGLVIGVSAEMPIYDPNRAITRAEAATLISRFGSAQESIRYLSDFEKGYTNDKLCGLNVAPAIVNFTAAPRE